MQKNLNTKDALVRAFFGLCGIALFVVQFLDNILLEVTAGLLGLILLITAFIEFCPFYYLFGIRTRRKRRQKFY